MELKEKRAILDQEFEEYYSTYDPCTEKLLAKQEEIYAAHKDEPSPLLKARMIKMLSEECPVHLFRRSPFFHEFSSGRERHTWGGLQSHVGSFMQEKTADLWMNRYGEEMRYYREESFTYGWNNPVGFDHFCIGYDNILKEGLVGIRARALAALERETDARKRSFLTAAADSLESLMHLQSRFAAEAQRLAEAAADEEEKAHYMRIAEAAARVPAQPPRTFYEGLCAVVFCREAVGSLDGIGVSTFGHLDRMLGKLYDADLAAGRITEEEAKWLFHVLLTYTDIRFDARIQYNETSTTMILGGCDTEGTPVFNGVTRCILGAVLEGRYISTKINCRISSKHPQDYFDLLATVQTANIPVIVMQNDDTLIASRVRRGQAVEDARLYVSGGCHEIVLANTEVNTRADTWISLPRVLLDTIKREQPATWEEFYELYLKDVKDFIEDVVSKKNKYEAMWYDYAPLPLTSATLTGCIETGKDLTEGGAKYSSTALSLLGTATMVDSLYAIRHLVYEQKTLSLKELCDIVWADFAGQERLRSYIVRKLPKFGTNDPELNAFGAKLLDTLSTFAGQKNARGGDYLPAFYPHDIFRFLGATTPATPDGRKAFTPLSRGCSPSEFIEIKNPLDIVSGLSSIDFTAFAESFCTEITLPRMEESAGRTIFSALMHAFLENKGSTLQFNLIDRDMLLEAQRDPENHGDLIVRVCGYSAVFVTLSPEQQAEVIGRAIR